MTGQTSFGTGDINLAASLITLGIPPDATEPVRLIACENGKDYTRFHVGHLSYCGKYQTAAMMAGWSDPVTFKLLGPNHPLNVLMGFITARPRGCSNLDQWLEHAAAFLKMPMDAVRSNFKSITKTCQASPECPSSYVLAFVRNRIDLIAAAKKTESKGLVKNMMSQGRAFSIIPAKAPKRIQDFLLSHLR